MSKLLRQLMVNCKSSDRAVAEQLGLSQPTVSRTRVALERCGYILGYTAIPNLSKLGYEFVAFSIGCFDTSENIDSILRDNSVIFASKESTGDVFIISAHKTQTDYVRILRKYVIHTGFVILTAETPIRPFSFKNLVEEEK